MLLASPRDFIHRRKTMRSRFPVRPCIVFIALLFVAAAAHSQSVRQIPLTRNVPFPATLPAIPSATQGPEFDSTLVGGDADSDGNDSAGPGIALNRTISQGSGSPMSHHGSAKAKSHPELNLSMDGINHF